MRKCSVETRRKHRNIMLYGSLEHTHRLKKIMCAELLKYFDIIYISINSLDLSKGILNLKKLE